MKQGNFLPTVAAALIIIVTSGFILFRSSFLKSAIPLFSPTPTTIESDFPPLYPGIKWDKTYEGKLFFVKENHEAVEEEGVKFESEVLKYQPQNILTYFNEELELRGWIQTEVADGPSGEVLGYQKNEKYFTVQYTTISDGTGPDRDIKGYKVIIYHN